MPSRHYVLVSLIRTLRARLPSLRSVVPSRHFAPHGTMVEAESRGVLNNVGCARQLEQALLRSLARKFSPWQSIQASLNSAHLAYRKHSYSIDVFSPWQSIQASLNSAHLAYRKHSTKRANEQRHRCLHSSDLVVTQINYFSFCITGTLLLMLCSSEMSVSVEITPDIS